LEVPPLAFEPGAPRVFEQRFRKGECMTEIVGLFDSRHEAERAIDDLYALGYSDREIGFINRQEAEYTNDVGTAGTAGDEAVKGAAGGAVGGAAVGAGAGLLASAGMLLMPGIGPFLAAGTLAGTLAASAAGAAGGAVLGGAAGAIFGPTTNDEYSDYYRKGVDRGGALVTVEAVAGRESEAADALRAAGAKKVDQYGEGDWV
jgi:hypothetical protein